MAYNNGKAIDAQYKFDSTQPYGTIGLSMSATGKFPVVGKLTWNTVKDMESFLNDTSDSAIPGMILTVVGDTDSNNGVYFVKSVKTSKTTMSYVKLGSGGSGGSGITQSDIDNIIKTIKGNVDSDDYDTFEEINDAIDGIVNTIGYTKIVKNASPSDATVKEEYKLMVGGTQKGDTIKIYKDSSLENAELITGPYSKIVGSTKVEVRDGSKALVLTYTLANGNNTAITIDMTSLMNDAGLESAAGSGLEWDNGNRTYNVKTATIDDYDSDDDSDAVALVSDVKKALENVGGATYNDKAVSHQYVSEVDQNSGRVSPKRANLDTNAVLINGSNASAKTTEDAVITVSGVTVGNLTAGTKITAGTSLFELLKQMLVKELFPTSAKVPTASLTTSKTATTYEIGTPLASTVLTAKYTAGTVESYDGDTKTNIAAGESKGNITFYKNGTAVTAAGLATTYTIPNGINVVSGKTVYKCTIGYSASKKNGVSNLGNKGTNGFPAGTAEASLTYTGKYRWWNGISTIDMTSGTSFTNSDITKLGLTSNWEGDNYPQTLKVNNKEKGEMWYIVVPEGMTVKFNIGPGVLYGQPLCKYTHVLPDGTTKIYDVLYSKGEGDYTGIVFG